MIRLLEEIETVREDKVLEPSDVDMLQGRDGIRILEATIEYGNRHTLALHSDIMEALAIEHFYLFLATSVKLSLETVPGVERGVCLLADHSGNTVR